MHGNRPRAYDRNACFVHAFGKGGRVGIYTWGYITQLVVLVVLHSDARLVELEWVVQITIPITTFTVSCHGVSNN